MKKFHLSTPAERTVGIIYSVIMSAVLVVLLFALREDVTMLLLTGAGAVLIVGILALYVLNVSKAACIPDVENKTLLVEGFQQRTLDLSKAVCLQTVTVKSGHVESRKLVFTDAEGEVVATVPTYFTSKRGVLAEPMAKELAAELGLEFLANVPQWEYDEEARKAHDIEVAQQEKEEAQARKELRKKAREAKYRQKINEIRKEKK